MPAAKQEITLSTLQDSRDYWGMVLGILPRTHHIVMGLETDGVETLCLQTQEMRVFPWSTRARVIAGERLLEVLSDPANEWLLKLTYERHPGLQWKLERATELA